MLLMCISTAGVIHMHLFHIGPLCCCALPRITEMLLLLLLLCAAHLRTELPEEN